MADKKHIRTVGALLLAVFMSACSTMDRPYDPNFAQGESLFDQIPNWDGEALHRCAGHLPPEQRQPHQTGRC